MTDPKKERAAKFLKPNSLKMAQFERGSFFCMVPNDTTYDEVMTPAFWQHHVAALANMPNAKPFARVEVMREDGTMDLDLRVLECKPGMVKMRCLRKFISDENIGKPAKGAPQPGDEALEWPPGYKGSHVPRGEITGWMVRLPSSEILAKGLPSKLAAVEAAKRHLAEASKLPT